MRVARRTFLASTLAAGAAPALPYRASSDAPPVILKLHHSFSAVSSVHDKFLVPWKRRIEAEAGERLRIDVFPSMELGGAPAQLIEQARTGEADIVWAAPGLSPGRFPKITTFELPFLPSRRALVSSLALQDFAAVYLKDEFNDVQPLCFSCADRSVIHAYAPVRSIEDIKGVKLHAQTRLAGEALRVLGAHPVEMPSEELPAALAGHVVEGCVDPWHLVPPLRLNDILKAHTEFSDLSLSSRTYVLAMNKQACEGLPHDIRLVLDRNSGALAAAMAGAMWDIQARAVAENVAQTGDIVVTLLPEAVAHWRKATEPVVDNWLKEMRERRANGGAMIAAAHSLLTKYAGLPEPEPVQTPGPGQETASAPPPRSGGVTTTSNARVPATPSPQPGAAPSPAPHVATPPRMSPVANPPAATSGVMPTPSAPAIATAPPAVMPVPPPAPALPPKTLDIPL